MARVCVRALARLALSAIALCACGRVQGSAPSADGWGTVLLKTDSAGLLAIDGRAAGPLSPGVAQVTLTQGTHRLSVATVGGEESWEQAVAVERTQVVRLVHLASAVDQVRQDYVRVAAESFQMGCVEGDAECGPDERPRAAAIDRDFWMMRTEVTVAAYAAAAGKAGRAMPPAPRFNSGWRWEHYPIVNVTWNEARDYCASVGGRLPTEAEWERAARGGHAGQRYVWGNDVRPVVAGYKQANVGDERVKGTVECQEGPCFEGYDDGYSGTSPMFQYSPNGLGLFDMAGNVWEWTAEPGPGSDRVLRGGSWKTGVSGLRISNRWTLGAQERADSVGFRCARDVTLPPASGAEEPSASPAAAPPGEMRLAVDVEAELAIDGRPMGTLAPGPARVLGLEQGEHLVAVASRGGEARREEVVAVGASPVVLAWDHLGPVTREVRRDYVRVPAGIFQMGCVEGDLECVANEKPRHAVALSRDFWIMKTEVTVGAYRAWAGASGRAMPEASDVNVGWANEAHPISNVTWPEAAAYCQAAGGRLPTEAEWEYAARGGRTGRRYVWGNETAPVAEGRKHANVGDERTKARVACPQCGWFDGYDDGHVYTAPVASFAANGFGLFDMAGNVAEWCADWYRERYYDESPAADPRGSAYGRWRVLRGGSWSMNPQGLRTSARGGFPPDRTTDNYGFRCVREVALP